MERKNRSSYSYFDHPDGEDVYGKLIHVLKPTALVAGAISTIDVMCHSHPKGYLKTLGRYAYIGLPIIAVSTAFVCTTNIACSVRKKDDIYNWFMGGFAAGSVFGIWRRSPMMGFNMGMFLGIIAAVKKDTHDQGWNLKPGDDLKISNGGVWINKMDWTLTAPRPGNWTPGK